MLEIWKTQVRPLTGRKLRKVYVYVPDEAMENPEARFPVLYMFDGHNVFLDSEATYGKSWGMKDYMDATGTPMIIVGVDCDHSPDNGRLSEYSPFSFEAPGIGKITGRGKLFMDWVCSRLKPMIDKRYPTIRDREHTWIAGSSMGGLMTIYAVTAYNEVFSKGVALSPSVWVAPKRLDEMIEKSEMAADTVLYMNYGSREMSNHEGMAAKYYRAMNTLAKKNIMLTSRIVPNGDHCEACWEQEIPIFMPVLHFERE